MKRRTKGDGSIYQRKDGRWCGEYTDALGKRRYITGKTKADVKAKLKIKLKERDEGVSYADADKLAFGDFLDQWLSAIKGTIRDRSWIRYEQITRVHLKPALGHVKLSKLSALQLQDLYATKSGSGLSPRTVQYIHTTAHTALSKAVRWLLIPRNVAEAATPPRNPRKEMKILSKDQVRNLLRTAKDTQPTMYALYALAVTTGARSGELLGLQPHDIDLDEGTISIRRSVYNGVVSEPKTSAGRRTILLSKIALDALEDHTSNHAGNTWLFATSKDTTISCHNLHNRSWKPLLKACGLPQSTRFHDLRHGAASYLIGEGVPIPVVAHLMGHRIETLVRVYTHRLKDQQGTAALAMNGLLEESPTDTLQTA